MKTPGTSPWTPELIDKLSLMWLRGDKTNDIGRALGISKNACVAKAHRLGLPARPAPASIAAARAKGAGVRKVDPASTTARVAPTCAWPIGDPGKPGFRFCGAPRATVGRPYCAEHTDKARSRTPVAPLKP